MAFFFAPQTLCPKSSIIKSINLPNLPSFHFRSIKKKELFKKFFPFFSGPCTLVLVKQCNWMETILNVFPFNLRSSPNGGDFWPFLAILMTYFIGILPWGHPSDPHWFSTYKIYIPTCKKFWPGQSETNSQHPGGTPLRATCVSTANIFLGKKVTDSN